jgi:hypothetical protein
MNEDKLYTITQKWLQRKLSNLVVSEDIEKISLKRKGDTDSTIVIYKNRNLVCYLGGYRNKLTSMLPMKISLFNFLLKNWVKDNYNIEIIEVSSSASMYNHG